MTKQEIEKLETEVRRQIGFLLDSAVAETTNLVSSEIICGASDKKCVIMVQFCTNKGIKEVLFRYAYVWATMPMPVPNLAKQFSMEFMKSLMWDYNWKNLYQKYNTPKNEGTGLQDLLIFLNMTKIGDTVTRQSILDNMTYLSNSSVDNYKNLLIKHNYLGIHSSGVYKILKNIPIDLTYTELNTK